MKKITTYLPNTLKQAFLHKYACPHISKSVDCVCLLAKMKWHGSSAVLIQCGGDSWAWRLEAAHVIFCPGAPDLSHPEKLSLSPSSITQVSTALMHYLLALACCLINYRAIQGYLYLPLCELLCILQAHTALSMPWRGFRLSGLLHCLFVLRSCRRVRSWYNTLTLTMAVG